MTKLEWPDNFVYDLVGTYVEHYNDYDATLNYVLSTLSTDEYGIIKDRYANNMSLSLISMNNGNISPQTIGRRIKNIFASLERSSMDKIMMYGVKGYIDHQVKIKIGDHVETALKSFLTDEHRELLDIINNLYEHAQNFTSKPYICCYTEDKDIGDLELPVKVYNALKRKNINTIRDILNNEENIMDGRIKNIGKGAIYDIEMAMQSMGYDNFGKYWCNVEETKCV